jgi:putative addiction module killer protein
LTVKTRCSSHAASARRNVETLPVPTPQGGYGARDGSLEQGNLSNVKPVDTGVLEYRINFGPGYRVYFGRDGELLVIVLTGGTKKPQQRDIETAIDLWDAYKRRKRGGR